MPDTFSRWLQGLEARHTADLTFPEVARALRALSATYVERRRKIAEGAALSSAGKRAAFALFYGPLHFLLIRHIVATLPLASAPSDVVVDLGCGTGAAGAAWASGSGTRTVFGVDRNPWATAEAIRTYREFGLDGRVRRDDITTVRLPKARSAVVAAFTMNELSDEARDDVMGRLVERVERGDRILVVEPLAGFVAPWWNRWRDAFASMGGRADEWRVKTELPPIVAKLDRAAGLDHREITGRSLWSG